MLLCGAAAIAATCGLAAAQVTVTQKTWTTTGGTAKGWIAVVDLNDPRLQLKVTAPLDPVQSYEAVLTPTNTWHTANANKLSINANYFGTNPDGTTADVLGLSISDGVTVSPFRQYGANPDPALYVGSDNRARIGYFTSADVADAKIAVAGIGPSASDAVAGTFLVTNGVNTGTTTRVDPLNRNPRTAIGTNQYGDKLYIVEVDGRQTGWSVGMTNPEVADILVQMGAWRAINLDGGGSSSFINVIDKYTGVSSCGAALQNS
jgi:exopolysaccharide biosynthesis protein